MKILLASSEVHPYSKTGGLADMVGALGKALAQAGHQVGIVTPLYRGIVERFPEIRRVDWKFDLPLGGRRVQAELWSLEPDERLTIYFIHQPAYFDRAGFTRRMARITRTTASGLFSFRNAWRIWRAICRGNRKSCMSTIGRPDSCQL